MKDYKGEQVMSETSPHKIFSWNLSLQMQRTMLVCCNTILCGNSYILVAVVYKKNM